MEVKILTENGIDNTNIDGARQNHFSSGMRSGIVKGAFNEGKFFASANNVIALDTCELRISGHQVIIDEPYYYTFNDSDRPSTPTKYSLIAEISVDDNSKPTFRLFIQSASEPLIQENLFKTNTGNGTYQLRIGNFTLGTTGLISDVVRTCDVITGGGEGGVADIKFNATATQLSSSSQPEVNVDFNEETKEYDMYLGIPAGGGSKVTIGGVEQPTWSADFAESERQKSKNLVGLYSNSSTDNGLTYIINEQNQTITFNGTLTTYSEAHIGNIRPITLKAGKTYTFTIFKQSGSLGLNSLNLFNSKIGKYDNLFGMGFTDSVKDVYTATKTFSEDITYDSIRIYGLPNSVCDNSVLKLQIEEGNITTDWQYPYGAITHNGDAPVVFAEAERQKSKNLFFYNKSIDINSNNLHVTYDKKSQLFCFDGQATSDTWDVLHNNLKLPAGTYTLSVQEISGSSTGGRYKNVYFYFVNAEGVEIDNIPVPIGANEVVTFNEDVVLLRNSLTTHLSNVFNNYLFGIQIEEGSTKSDWQPYNGAIVHEKEILKDFWSGTVSSTSNELMFNEIGTDFSLLPNYTFNTELNRNIEKVNNDLVVSKSGYYYVDINTVIIRTDATSVNNYISAWVDGSQKLVRNYNNLGTSKKATVSVSGIVKCNAGSHIGFRFLSDNANATGVINGLNITVKEI